MQEARIETASDIDLDRGTKGALLSVSIVVPTYKRP
jgi:hypothetical protein